MRRKLALGPWSRPALRALARMRWVRGTWLDPFGFTSVRRTERALLREYRVMASRVLDEATVESREDAVRLLELPLMIRGFEGIKMASVKAYRERLRQMLMADSPVA
jgi:indolepyruvate ferredoxin oxidoreductase